MASKAPAPADPKSATITNNQAKPRPTGDELKRAHKEYERTVHNNYFDTMQRVAAAFWRETTDELARAVAEWLQDLNRQYYRFRPEKARTLTERLKPILRQEFKTLVNFRKRSIKNLTESDATEILRLFGLFQAQCDPIGAGKALHVLAPTFFPLWDNKIAERYGVDTKAGYFKFMNIVKHQVLDLPEEIAPGVTALKALDEYNYLESNSRPTRSPPTGPAPFEEPFWQRYSPHHEFPLSSATSIALHVLALVFLIVAGWFVASLLEKSKLEVDTITMAGGGGNPRGEGNAPGDRPPEGGAENVETAKNEQAAPTSPTPAADLKKPVLDPLDVVLADPNARTIDQANQAVQNLKKLSVDARSKLLNSLGPGKGRGGSGSDGGKDTGKDKGEGPFTGPGKNKFSQRQTRVLRWVMQFNTYDGNDYRRQLAGLGAILAFPQPDGGYMVYRNLNERPAKGQIEDIAGIKRIFWVDDKKKSIESLSEAMGVPVPDSPIVAFFPVELEAELLKKELKYRNKKEDEIRETHFKINSRSGKFVPEVVEQYY